MELCDGCLPGCNAGSACAVRCVETWTAWNWVIRWNTRCPRGKETKSVLRRSPKWLLVRRDQSSLHFFFLHGHCPTITPVPCTLSLLLFYVLLICNLPHIILPYRWLCIWINNFFFFHCLYPATCFLFGVHAFVELLTFCPHSEWYWGGCGDNSVTG